MTIPAAYAITALPLSAETFRQAPSSLIAGTGVVGSADLAVTATTPASMSVNVATGQVWVPGTLSSTAGFPTNLNAQTGYGLPSSFNEQASYFGWNNATVNLAIAAAAPTNPRIDIVCASVQDAFYSGSNNQAVLQVITGTPAPAPSAPSAPATSVVLAQIAVAANASSIVTADITDVRPFLGLASPAQPVCQVNRSAAYTDPNTTLTTCPFDTVAVDNYGGYSTSTFLYTCPLPGLYLVTAAWARSEALAANQAMQVLLKKDGAAAKIGATVQLANVQFVNLLNSEVVGLLDCGAGTTIGASFTDWGGGGVAAGSAVQCFMDIVRVSV